MFRVMSRKDERNSCCKKGKRSVWVMGEKKGGGSQALYQSLDQDPHKHPCIRPSAPLVGQEAPARVGNGSGGEGERPALEAKGGSRPIQRPPSWSLLHSKQLVALPTVGADPRDEDEARRGRLSVKGTWVECSRHDRTAMDRDWWSPA